MNEISLQILTFLYGLVSVTGLMGYIPTIKSLWINKENSANFLSYFIWFIGSIVSCLYGIFIIKDFIFISFSGVGAILNGVVLILIFNNKNAKSNKYSCTG